MTKIKIAPADDDVEQLYAQLPHETIESFPLRELVPHPKNFKEHDIGAICESIKRHGPYGHIYAQRWPDTPPYIIAGHGRREAMLQLGIENFRVTFYKVGPRKAFELLLVDNRTNELGGYNEAQRLAVLSEAATADPEGLLGTGFDDEALSDFAMLSQPLDFSPSANRSAEPELPYKAHEAVIVHVKDVLRTGEVSAAIAQLLNSHPEWQASIFARA